MLFPLCLFAQNEGERFWSGSLGVAAIENARYSSGSTTNNSTYSMDVRLNKGKFISNNRMIYAGVNSNVALNGGNGRTNGRYVVGAQVGLAKYYTLATGLHATFNHELSCLYGWNGAKSAVSSYIFNYRLAPGLIYRMNEKFALQVNLALLNAGITRQYSSNIARSQTVVLNLLPSTQQINLNVVLFYFPFQAQRKKHP